MSTTTDLNKITDEQMETEVKTLQGKTDATAEEKEKLSALKEERQTRYQKKIDILKSKEKEADHRAKQLEKQLEEEKAKRIEIEKERESKAKPKIVDETVAYGGKKYYTDESLTSMVANEELTPQQAYAHQRSRDKAEIYDEIERKQTEKSKESENRRAFEDDKTSVLDQYPNFHPNHPDHDPEDPLYKTASEIWVEGYQNNPRGLSLAIKRAKQILRISDTRPDTTEEHSVGRSRGGSEMSRSSTTEVTLSPQEKEAATRMWGGIINPVTKREYTETEAIAKATKAKTARMQRN